MTLAAFTVGDNALALEQVGLALAHSDFELEQHRALAVRHWIDPRVATYTFAAILHALLCRPELCRLYVRESLELAERISHPNTTAFALLYAAASSQMLREPKQALEYASASLTLSQQHRLQLWLGWSALLKAWASTELSPTPQGLAALRHGLGMLQGSGVLTTPPYFLGLIAELHWKLGQLTEGLAAAQEGLRWAESTGEHANDAELHRLEAELLRRLGREEEAARSFAQALAVARQQGALLFELRATVGLARQLEEAGRGEEARERLAALCLRVSPERDCVDLAEARALLARLSSPARDAAWGPSLQ
jgi:predicted ATPase